MLGTIMMGVFLERATERAIIKVRAEVREGGLPSRRELRVQPRQHQRD